ncbi:head GIN domain-containing protein [Flavobacterium lindanitolerans]|uniref:head GIN domain-containing protein n=1 Tax=Flavobacterium lindanitolerans TaxID=428988 RepID=UPI0027B9E782|nr:head GIN domain-containing protein [Flavobacterium lindanitolerans]
MIRIIIYLMKLIIALLFALFFSSCRYTNERTITGSGNVRVETRNVTGFKGINVSNALEVEVEQGDAYQVVVEADENLLSHIITRVENGILHIEADSNTFRNIDARKIKVKLPVIVSLEASSASKITSIGTLITEKLLVDASSAAGIDIAVEADELTCNSSSASSVDLKGKALKFKANSSSASEIDADQLLANDVIAVASSAATISAHPILTLDAEASSGGNISYNNTPRNTLKQNADSGGGISKNE